MLTCFNLRPGANIDEFRRRLERFHDHMQALDLVHSTGAVGRRQKHPVMDTDEDRDHEFFFIMSFRDREQCDRSVEYIEPRAEPSHSLHSAVFSLVADPVFICWEDL